VAPEQWIPPPIDLGKPMPRAVFRRVTYWYDRSLPGGGIARWLHLYLLDPADEDMTWAALHPAPPVEEDLADPARKAPRRTLGAPRRRISTRQPRPGWPLAEPLRLGIRPLDGGAGLLALAARAWSASIASSARRRPPAVRPGSGSHASHDSFLRCSVTRWQALATAAP
jgi:hypothetical protein